MSKKRSKKWISQEKILVGIGVVLLTSVVAIVVYALAFLSNSVFPVLSSDVGGGAERTEFNTEGFEELGL